MPETLTSQFDVFISYSHKDERWVREVLVSHFKEAGISICIDSGFQIGEPTVEAIERAILSSRRTILVLSTAYFES